MKNYTQKHFTGNCEHRRILLEALTDKNINVWNNYKKNALDENNIRPNLKGLYLKNAKLSKAHLGEADFTDSKLINCDFSQTKLNKANFSNASLTRVNFSQAELRVSDFSHAKLDTINFSGADLKYSIMIKSTFKNVIFNKTKVYGTSIWDINGLENKEDAFIASPDNNKIPILTVDNIEAAHLIHLLTKTDKIGKILDSVRNKLVLILGRFTPEQKEILETIKTNLSKEFVPLIFDFKNADKNDITETIRTLACLSKFIFADLSNPRSVPHELYSLVPDLKIPFVPLIKKGQKPYSMFVDIQSKYDWILPVAVYKDKSDLENHLEKVISEAKKVYESIIEEKESAKISICKISEYNVKPKT